MPNRSIYDDRITWGNFTESSVRTPYYRSLLKAGIPLPDNPYSFYRLDAKAPISSTYNGDRTERDARGLEFLPYNGYFSNQTGAGDSFTSLWDLENQLHAKLNAKIRDSDVNLAIALGEASKTADLIGGTAVKIAKSFRHLRRRDVSAAMRVLTGKPNNLSRHSADSAASLWLTYTYGVSPLLNDISGALKALDKVKKPYIPVHTVRAAVKENIKSTCFNYFSLSQFSGQFSARGLVRFKVTNPVTKSLDSVGFINPLSVAWELVPFSFVVDWFIPVGTFIENIVPPQGVDDIKGVIGLKASGDAYHSTSIPPSAPGDLGWETSCTGSSYFIQRKPITSIPRYKLTIPDLSLSRNRMMSGISLLWTVLSEGGKIQRR
jgi:hypothetical protein